MLKKASLIKKITLMIITVLLTAMPCGCYDRREVDDLAYVLAMGFDRGVTDRLRLTLQIVSFKEGGGGGGTVTGMSGGGSGGGGEDQELGQVGGTMVVTVDCPSVFTGLNLANVATSRQLNLMHAKLIIFSEELARSGELEKYLNAVLRYREIRETMDLVITKGKAEEYIRENKGLIGQDPSKSMELLINQQDYTGFFPEVKYYNFYTKMKSSMQQPVAILAGVNSLKNLRQPGQGVQSQSASGGDYLAGEVPRRGGPKRELFGGAVFYGPTMVGELTGTEVRVLKMLTGELERAFYTIKDPLAPDFVVPLDVRPARKPEIKVNLEGDTPEVDVKIRLEGAELSIQSGIHYEGPELKPVLEQAFAEEIKRQADDLIAKCQNDFKADIFGFGKIAVRHFPTIKEWEEYRWLEKFPQARVYTDVDFVIRRTGMMLKTSPKTGEEGGAP